MEKKKDSRIYGSSLESLIIDFSADEAVDD